MRTKYDQAQVDNGNDLKVTSRFYDKKGEVLMIREQPANINTLANTVRSHGAYAAGRMKIFPEYGNFTIEVIYA